MEVELHLQSLNNERLNLRSVLTSPEQRLDMKAGGFWLCGATAFFDVRVTHVKVSLKPKEMAKIGDCWPYGQIRDKALK